jgi:hypothetical protein
MKVRDLRVHEEERDSTYTCYFSPTGTTVTETVRMTGLVYLEEHV